MLLASAMSIQTAGMPGDLLGDGEFVVVDETDCCDVGVADEDVDEHGPVAVDDGEDTEVAETNIDEVSAIEWLCLVHLV